MIIIIIITKILDKIKESDQMTIMIIKFVIKGRKHTHTNPMRTW